MTAAPLPVTVVVPAYERAALVLTAVRSALAQDPPPAQVLVVDDGSTDGTAALLAQAEPGVRVLVQANAGVAAARNAGLAAAEHDWVALLDADDWWLPGHLAGLWAARADHVLLSSSAVSSRTRRVLGATTRGPRVLRRPDDLVWPDNPLVTSGVLLRREAALAAGGFPPLTRSEDLALWLALLRSGTALSLPQVTCVYREHDAQASGDVAPMLASLGEVAAAGGASAAAQRRVATRLDWDALRASPAGGGAPLLRAVAARSARSPAWGLRLARLLATRAVVTRRRGAPPEVHEP